MGQLVTQLGSDTKRGVSYSSSDLEPVLTGILLLDLIAYSKGASDSARRDLGVQLQGVRANSQLSTPCYTAKEDSIVDEQDDRDMLLFAL